MGWVAMSERDMRRIDVLSEVVSGRREIGSAAAILSLSERQIRRLLGRLRASGGAALAHQARGRASNHRTKPGVQDYAVALVRERYADFGPTLAAEMLGQHHGLKISRETLRKWMVEAGIWLSRGQRRQFHQPRLRREALGELIQVDGSDHRWFEDRADPCTLLVFIADATSRLMQLRFVVSESRNVQAAAMMSRAMRGGLGEAGAAERSGNGLVVTAARTEKSSEFAMLAAETAGCLMILEATHTSDPSLDAAMILFKAVVQAGTGPVPDGLAQHAADRPRVGTMT